MIEFLKMEFHEDELVKTAAGREVLEYMGFVEEEGASAFAAIYSGCASVMIDDGDSMVFTYPVSISEDADEADIIEEIIRFCTDCEIEPIFIDTPRDTLPLLLDGVRHADVDGDGEFFTVKLKNECMLLEYPPETLSGEVYLSEPAEKFAAEYKRLILDSEHNAFWGNDLRAEMTGSSAKYFVTEAIDEFYQGTAITLHATTLDGDGENKFVGEGVLYRFDFKGGCEVAVRVLPEHCKKGYGRAILEGLIEIARQIGLTRLVCNIDKRNIPAIRFTKGLFELCGEDEGTVQLSADI